MTVFDTSAWIEYFAGSKKGLPVKDRVNSDAEIFTPSVCLAEIKLKYAKEKPELTKERLAFVLGRSAIVDLNQAIALLSADNKLKHKLYLVDSVIYSTAQFLNENLLTSDADLKGLPGVVFLN
ncbi:type II toxin-antitoxin system VapC family toxin [Candidatus Woesearchaeota archaeon]|nr:type II toxin-antitoxin system VapC family toxin [Candidatus Woesearchaeota archaeon]